MIQRLALLCVLCVAGSAIAADRPNLLIITVDDMNADSVGAFGCELEGVTPNIDRLAARSLRFSRAHVQVGNCMPGRNVMWSGRYSHNNGVEGFVQNKKPGYPVLTDLMKQAGYFTAIRGKAPHSTPYHPYPWDLNLDTLPDGSAAHKKDAASFGASTTHGINAAKEAGKPFCLMINISDPHKPFYTGGDRHEPSRTYKPDEVPIPGFLFDDPAVRKELADYYSTVRRADDAVGAVVRALEASGQADHTFVMFFSDHGMPLPFAKTQLYHHSTWTPLIVRWPGVTRAGAVDDAHMVSAVDFLPTLLDLVGAPHPDGLDGRSFLPVIKGEPQADRDMVFKEYNQNSAGTRELMRAVQTPRYLYIFNPWSDGVRDMRTATKGTATYRRMKELAKTDPTMAARLRLIDHRVLEELYDVASDPDALVNLIDDPKHAAELAKLRTAIEDWMVKTGDPTLDVFRQRDEPEARAAFNKHQESISPRAQRKKK